jgi:CDGSH-type Zn-finger protein/uncharacterized Fe-S cluster protein YjdI
MRRPTKVREYDAEGITVTYDVKRCIHAEECVRGLGRVFDPSRRVWVDPTQANADEIAAVIRRCPTGALHFHRKDGGSAEPTPVQNEVRITRDGPLYLRGDLEIHTPTGVLKDTRASLCRCGASRNKPFCDKSHVNIAFPDAGAINAQTSAAELGAGALRVLPQKDGPCLIEGPLTLISGDGATTMYCGPKAWFCRCGHSGNKPFCDGSHAKVGFRDG